MSWTVCEQELMDIKMPIADGIKIEICESFNPQQFIFHEHEHLYLFCLHNGTSLTLPRGLPAVPVLQQS